MSGFVSSARCTAREADAVVAHTHAQPLVGAFEHEMQAIGADGPPPSGRGGQLYASRELHVDARAVASSRAAGGLLERLLERLAGIRGERARPLRLDRADLSSTRKRGESAAGRNPAGRGE
jgi:hypothetical protein